MYPYTPNHGTTPLSAKEKPLSPSLSDDRRLQELLQLAGRDAAQTEKKYTALLAEESLQNAESILKTMETDSKKHRRILRELLYTIFSDTAEEILEDAFEEAFEPKDTEDLLEELLFAELDDITFYRNLLAALAEEDDLWHLLFEIITDKQNHAAALNHLYAKYFAKSTGN